MTTIAELSLPAQEFALAETIARLTNVSLRVESVVAEGPVRTTPLIWFVGAEQDAIERALEADPSVDEAQRLLGDESEWFYRLEYGDGVASICRTLYTSGGTVLEAQVSDSHWIVRLLFPDRDDLSQAVDEFEADDVHVDVRRMVEAGADDDLETSAALTEPQREAIAAAYREGYYDVPRDISLEDLASELGISHQALSERLRRANRVLAGEQLDASGTVVTE